jgi:hypothetical protein
MVSVLDICLSPGPLRGNRDNAQPGEPEVAELGAWALPRRRPPASRLRHDQTGSFIAATVCLSQCPFFETLVAPRLAVPGVGVPPQR